MPTSCSVACASRPVADVRREDLQRPALVDLEADLDGDLAARRGAQAGELDLAEVGVLAEGRVLSLGDPDADDRLHVARRREGPRALAGDLRVALDDDVAPAADRLDDERARRHVDEDGRGRGRQRRACDGGGGGVWRRRRDGLRDDGGGERGEAASERAERGRRRLRQRLRRAEADDGRGLIGTPCRDGCALGAEDLVEERAARGMVDGGIGLVARGSAARDGERLRGSRAGTRAGARARRASARVLVGSGRRRAHARRRARHLGRRRCRRRGSSRARP